MPYLKCPQCSTSVKYGFDDTSARCESCAIDVPVPELDPAPPIEALPRTAPVSAQPMPSWPRPRPAYDEVDDFLSGASRPRYSDSRDMEDWRVCRNGLRVAVAGMAVVVLVLIVIVLSATLVPAMRPGQRMDRDPAIPIALVALGGLTLLGALAHLVGQITCCFSPRPYHSSAVRSMICLGLAILAIAGLFCAGLFFGMAGGGHRVPIALPMIGGTVVALLMLATYCYWLTFLAKVAGYFRASGLETSCNAQMITQVILYAIQFAFSIFAAMTILPHEASVGIGALFNLIQIGLLLWYVVNLSRVTSVVGANVDRR